MFNSKTFYSVTGTISGVTLASMCFFQPQESTPTLKTIKIPSQLTNLSNPADTSPRLFAKPTPRNDFLISKMSPLLNEYKPCWFYFTSLGYIIASLFISAPKQLEYERCSIAARTEVGGLITFDLKRSEIKNTNKAMLIVPGVTGSS